MAQKNFLLQDGGGMVMGINGNATSAITAGDILYASPASASPFGTTVPNGEIYDEIEVEPVKFATALTQGRFIVGVALHDAAAGSQVSFATEGLWFSPVIDTTGYVQAGALLRAAEGTTYPGVTNVCTTALTLDSSTGVGATEVNYAVQMKIGYALTSAETDGDYIIWKFSK